VAGDVNGLRLGTPEIVRFGMRAEHMPELAGYIMEGLAGARPAEAIAKDVTAFRGRFRELCFMR
jgi:glycine hydroxymethyltransferase